MSNSIKNILIYGMGMMGASLAHSIRKYMTVQRIDGVVRSKKSAAFIKGHQIADQVMIHESLSQFKDLNLDDYDLVVFGIPPLSIVSIVPLIPESDILITDMSSTRRSVHNAFAKRPTLRFQGSHPMCGSEKSGPSAGLPDLFKNHLCLIIEDKNIHGLHKEDRQTITNIWHQIGMETSTINANEHDKVLSYLSHTPHVISSLLTHWAESNEAVRQATDASPIPITGGGFRSMARIAGSNPQMWTDILNTNSDHIKDSLTHFHNMLGQLIEGFTDTNEGDWISWHKKSRESRNYLCDFENK